MTAPDPVAAFQAAETAVGTRYKLERLVAANRERVLFLAVDRVLKRRVSLRLNFYSDEPTRAWFLREAEALGQLDHPAIRHVYDVGEAHPEDATEVGNAGSRCGNRLR